MKNLIFTNGEVMPLPENASEYLTCEISRIMQKLRDEKVFVERCRANCLEYSERLVYLSELQRLLQNKDE
jgi:hypothetical protein